jgi:hypothetical protein
VPADAHPAGIPVLAVAPLRFACVFEHDVAEVRLVAPEQLSREAEPLLKMKTTKKIEKPI